MASSFHYRRRGHRAFGGKHWSGSMWGDARDRAVYLDMSCGLMVYHGFKRRRLAYLYRYCNPILETLRNKVSGGDMKWLVVLSGSCSLGIFGYLNAGEILKGMGNTLAVLAGAVSMVLLVKTVCRKYPKLMEYSLGIAMIIGMIFALGYDQLLK